MEGKVFNIQKFSIDDGPGIRTTVFLKGCNLKCIWCHNPESLESDFEIQFYTQKCLACGRCVDVCPNQAQKIEQGERKFLRKLCQKCGKCVEVCPSGALLIAGKTMTVKDVMLEVEKDRPFYDQSMGGVTFSGGEPMIQIDYLKELLRESKRKGFHTSVDTAGNVPWNNFLEVLPYVDLFLFDLKAMDENKHIELTGSSNNRILDNLNKLSTTGVEIWVRIPVIPDVNLLDNEAERMCEFLSKLEGIKKVELLPFHKFGESKYESLQMSYKCNAIFPPDEEYMLSLKSIFKIKGTTIIE